MKNAVVGIVGYGLIGQEIARHLTAQKYQVIVFDKEPQTIENFFSMDATSEASVQGAINLLAEKNIILSSLINCSYPRGKNYGKKLEEVNLNSFNENVSLHLGAYFNIMKQFGFYFKANGGGSIVSFSSIYGVTAPKFDIYDNQPFTMPVEYAAIKAAILHLNKYMAKYFKGSNVRFNSISPGGIYNAHDKTFVDAYGKYSLNSSPGMILPQELNGSVEFLISNASLHMNGQNIIIDDGWTL